MKPEKKKARGTTAVRNEKRTIYIVCAALAAVFIIAVAVVLRGGTIQKGDTIELVTEK